MTDESMDVETTSDNSIETMRTPLRATSWWNGGVMFVGTVVAAVASFMLAFDAIKLTVSDAPLGCDVNAKLSCTTVAKSWQSTLLYMDGVGIPNAFFGLLAFGMFVGFIVPLVFGYRPNRLVRYVFALGVLGCDVFAVWLLLESLFSIQVMCPWCLTMDAGCFLLTVGALRWFSLTTPEDVSDGSKSFHAKWAGFTVSLMSLLVEIVVLAAIVLPLFFHALS